MSIKPYFQFTKSQRLGIFGFLIISVGLQLAYFFVDFSTFPKESVESQKWMALQTDIDSLKESKKDYSPKIYPFNPNFITDFKGYKLGMSVNEIDRLLAFRKTNKYVNSAEEFQNVTKVSDSLLKTLIPYFKFPDWLKNKKEFKPYPKSDFNKKTKIVIIDINNATKQDLIKVYGIGEGLSDRILKQKELLGAFVSMEQMKDIWGLSPEVIENLNQNFKVLAQPKIKKININEISLKELSQFPYFRYPLAKSIITYRSMNGDIKSAADLIKINGFPIEKIKIIGLYLAF
ncbi:MAG: helix-hairpin-helix domain-containing protein [Bacteroidota bacterium]